VFTLDENNESSFLCDCPAQQNIMIHQSQWHQLANLGDQPLKIVEIQYGDRCQEDDIERR
jgi:mannose-6-phosphate isomerase-like protein (cupin superfamily)